MEISTRERVWSLETVRRPSDLNLSCQKLKESIALSMVDDAVENL